MGVHPLIKHDEFPEQSPMVGKYLQVQFPEGASVRGLVVRDDVNYPRLNRCIVQLDDDRHLLIQTSDNDEVLKVVTEERRPLDETQNAVFLNGGYPKQGTWHLKRTKVCFWYDTNHLLWGTIVRDDAEAPFVGIVALDDGRRILTSECQQRPEK